MNTTIITENHHSEEMPSDVYQKLSNDRILFICNDIDDNLATDITATLLLKDGENSNQKISLFINSHNCEIRNALMICDAINIIKAPVETVCIGEAINEVVIILASGTKGLRFATKNSIISTSQLVNDWLAHVNLTDAKKYLDLVTADNKRMMEILARTTGKSLSKVMKDFDRRMFMTSQQAAKYGIIDKVVKFSKQIPQVAK